MQIMALSSLWIMTSSILMKWRNSNTFKIKSKHLWSEEKVGISPICFNIFVDWDQGPPTLAWGLNVYCEVTCPPPPNGGRERGEMHVNYGLSEVYLVTANISTELPTSRLDIILTSCRIYKNWNSAWYWSQIFSLVPILPTVGEVSPMPI